MVLFQSTIIKGESPGHSIFLWCLVAALTMFQRGCVALQLISPHKIWDILPINLLTPGLFLPRCTLFSSFSNQFCQSGASQAIKYRGIKKVSQRGKKALICLKGKLMTLFYSTLFSDSFSQQLPLLRLASWKDFLCWHGALQGTSPRALLRELQRYNHQVWCNMPRGPKTPPRTNNTNLDCAFAEYARAFVVPNIEGTSPPFATHLSFAAFPWSWLLPLLAAVYNMLHFLSINFWLIDWTICFMAG